MMITGSVRRNSWFGQNDASTGTLKIFVVNRREW
jgi:hypothetical protein